MIGIDETKNDIPLEYEIPVELAERLQHCNRVSLNEMPLLRRYAIPISQVGERFFMALAQLPAEVR